MVFDPSYSDINLYEFKSDENWTAFYRDADESNPYNAPKPLGKEIELIMFFNSDHTGDNKNHRSSTSYMVFMNVFMIFWHTKKQDTIEGAVLGSDSIAMKQGVEALHSIRCKLRMMGVEIYVPTYIYGDNMSVIHNTPKLDSVLKKKSNIICYHFVREAAAMKE